MLEHRANHLLGKPCVALDYALTAYWGEVISVSESYRVTLKYYHGVGHGYRTKEFFHGRVWSTSPYDDNVMNPEESPFFNRAAVIRFFKRVVLPNMRLRIVGKESGNC